MSDQKDRKHQTEFYWGCEAESSCLPLAQLVPPSDLRGGPGHTGLELRGRNEVGAPPPPYHRKSRLEGVSGNYCCVTVPICLDIKWQSSISSHVPAGQLGISSSSLGLSGLTLLHVSLPPWTSWLAQAKCCLGIGRSTKRQAETCEASLAKFKTFTLLALYHFVGWSKSNDWTHNHRVEKYIPLLEWKEIQSHGKEDGYSKEWRTGAKTVIYHREVYE